MSPPAPAPAGERTALRCVYWFLLVAPVLFAFLAGLWFDSLPAFPSTPVPGIWLFTLGLLLPACYLALFIVLGQRFGLLGDLRGFVVFTALVALWGCWEAAPALLTRLNASVALESHERATLVRQETALGWRRVPASRSSSSHKVATTTQRLTYLDLDDPSLAVEVPLETGDLGRLACFSEHRGLLGMSWLTAVRPCPVGTPPDNLAFFALHWQGLTSEAFALRSAPALATPREPFSNADNLLRQAAALGVEVAPAVLGLTLFEVAEQDSRRLYLANRLLLMVEQGQPLRVAVLSEKASAQLVRHGRWAFSTDGRRLYRCIPAGWCEVWAL